jgi:excisionase family DNA binding protein
LSLARNAPFELAPNQMRAQVHSGPCLERSSGSRRNDHHSAWICNGLGAIGTNAPKPGPARHDFEAQSSLVPMQGKADKKRAASAPTSSYDTLRFRIASDTENPGNREFLRAREAAFWLGVPLRSLHQYVQQGLLPSYKLGRHRLFRKAELLSALNADRTATRSEILR